MSTEADHILQSVFGYDDFHPLQLEIIANVLRKNDTLVIMPTGGGKSLCYQIPALLFDGLTVVVSPLISLMKDQVEQLVELGVAATYLNSSLLPDEYAHAVARVRRRDIKLLYLAPETLRMQRTLNLLASLSVDCLAIDEAHCISEWGHDFRPEYRQLIEVRRNFPDAVTIALTATATPRVRQDIKDSLGFSGTMEFIASFDRPNLFLQVAPKTNPAAQTIDFLRERTDQSGIIYCFSRSQVDELSVILAAQGFSVRPYHAGLSALVRRENQEAFIRDDAQIIVATIAFGMGINKPNVRFVVHYDLPKNIESYYQQIGRAGRDGLPSSCLLHFSYADTQKIRYFINEKQDARERRIAGQHLSELVRFAETDGCRRIPLLNYFGEDYHAEKCDRCDNCRAGEVEKTDITIHAQKFLSCVARTGELFGAGHISDVLRGSNAKKVLKFGHRDLSTWGIGQELSKKQWFHLSRQFLTKGLLDQDEKFGSLKLTPLARDVMRGQETVLGTLVAEERVPTDSSAPEYDEALFGVLRAKRKELADAANVPPYVIFSDRTLVEMTTYYPLSLESLLQVNGVGAVKLDRYGEVFLALIRGYCAEHKIEERPRHIRTLPVAANTHEKRRHVVVGERFSAGHSVPELMAEFGVKQGTIIDHLYRYRQDGHTPRADDLLDLSKLSEENRAAALAAFARHGVEFLRPVFDELGGSIDYAELKIIRLYYLSEEVE